MRRTPVRVRAGVRRLEPRSTRRAGAGAGSKPPARPAGDDRRPACVIVDLGSSPESPVTDGALVVQGKTPRFPRGNAGARPAQRSLTKPFPPTGEGLRHVSLRQCSESVTWDLPPHRCLIVVSLPRTGPRAPGPPAPVGVAPRARRRRPRTASCCRSTAGGVREPPRTRSRRGWCTR